jgi:hypothetical protein
MVSYSELRHRISLKFNREFTAKTAQHVIPFPLVALAQSQTYTSTAPMKPHPVHSFTDPQFLRFMEALQTYCGAWKNPGIFYNTNYPHENWIMFQFVLR